MTELKGSFGRLNGLIRTIAQDPAMSSEMEIIAAREMEFSSPMAAQLAAIAANPLARRAFEQGLDDNWDADADEVPRDAAEVIIGAGLHAAIYSAVRVAQGYERPLVLEKSQRVGGAFAVSREPTFYLNSRNRPGTLSLPQREGSLNVIPGGLIQPADLSGAEYQRNSDLAFAIRVTLEVNARVGVDREVTAIRYANTGTQVNKNNRRYRLKTSGGDILTDRVLMATGLGEPTRDVLRGDASDRILMFPEFMAWMDQPFPLRGMDRVAVIGLGDSARVAVEALCGQGPSQGMSVAALDFPSQIGWYGMNTLALTCEQWEASNRSRYKPIGRFFPRNTGQSSRIRSLPRANAVTMGYECCYVDEVPYDYAIICTGFERSARIEQPNGWEPGEMLVGSRSVAKRVPNEEVYTIGAGAYLSVSSTEARATEAFEVGENSAALFRYAGKTATLAMSLRGETAAVDPQPVFSPFGQPEAVRDFLKATNA